MSKAVVVGSVAASVLAATSNTASAFPSASTGCIKYAHQGNHAYMHLGDIAAEQSNTVVRGVAITLAISTQYGAPTDCSQWYSGYVVAAYDWQWDQDLATGNWEVCATNWSDWSASGAASTTTLCGRSGVHKTASMSKAFNQGAPVDSPQYWLNV